MSALSQLRGCANETEQAASETAFVVGQVWETRSPKRIFGDPDYWTIISLDGNAHGRMIAQARCGVVREFCLQGHHGCTPDATGGTHDEPHGFDLVRLVFDAPESR